VLDDWFLLIACDVQMNIKETFFRKPHNTISLKHGDYSIWPSVERSRQQQTQEIAQRPLEKEKNTKTALLVLEHIHTASNHNLRRHRRLASEKKKMD
jgi:hypothetical protein